MKRTIYRMIFIVTTSFYIQSCTSGGTGKGRIADSAEAHKDSGSSALSDKTRSAGALSESNKDVPTEWLLVPGASAGLTKINSNKADLVKRIGKPDGGDAAMGKSVAVWYAGHDTTAHSISVFSSTKMGIDDEAKVKQIRVTSPEFKTREGLHPLSSLADIQKMYAVKKTESYKHAGTSYSVYDCDKGIAFEIAPDSGCTAIIIHEGGVSGQTTYLKFRTTGK